MAENQKKKAKRPLSGIAVPVSKDVFWRRPTLSYCGTLSLVKVGLPVSERTARDRRCTKTEQCCEKNERNKKVAFKRGFFFFCHSAFETRRWRPALLGRGPVPNSGRENCWPSLHSVASVCFYFLVSRADPVLVESVRSDLWRRHLSTYEWPFVVGPTRFRVGCDKLNTHTHPQWRIQNVLVLYT